LVVIGLFTDLCIVHTVKDAADLGYSVVFLTDACQAETTEGHSAVLACFQVYCGQINGASFKGEMLGPTGVRS